MKNAFFKLAFPSFPPPGPGRRELYFWVLFAALHAGLGTGLVALLPDGPPGPGQYLSPAEGARPPELVRPVSLSLPARGPLPALVHFPAAPGRP